MNFRELAWYAFRRLIGLLPVLLGILLLVFLMVRAIPGNPPWPRGSRSSRSRWCWRRVVVVAERYRDVEQARNDDVVS